MLTYDRGLFLNDRFFFFFFKTINTYFVREKQIKNMLENRGTFELSFEMILIKRHTNIVYLSVSLLYSMVNNLAYSWVYMKIIQIIQLFDHFYLNFFLQAIGMNVCDECFFL